MLQGARPREMFSKGGYVLRADSAAASHVAGASLDEALRREHELFGFEICPRLHRDFAVQGEALRHVEAIRVAARGHIGQLSDLLDPGLDRIGMGAVEQEAR